MVTPRYTAAEAVVVHDDFYVGKTTRTRNFCEFCGTFIPVPRTYVSSVRPVPQYPGYGYNIFCTRPELL